jgi:hypothetical protein
MKLSRWLKPIKFSQDISCFSWLKITVTWTISVPIIRLELRVCQRSLFALVLSLDWFLSVLLYHISHQDWLRLKAPSLLKFLRWNLMSINSFIKQSMWPRDLLNRPTEMRTYPKNFNQDRSCNPSQSWYPVTNMIKQYSDEPIWRQDQDKQNYDSAY